MNSMDEQILQSSFSEEQNDLYWDEVFGELQLLVDRDEPDYQTLYLKSKEILEPWIDEVDRASARGDDRSVYNFRANYLMHCMGVAAFGLGQDDEVYLAEALQTFMSMDVDWQVDVADYLAKIHLYLGNYDEAKIQLDIFWMVLEDMIDRGDVDPNAIQYGLEHYLAGRLSVAWAMSDIPKHLEYFDQYLARISANDFVPADPTLMFTLFYTYVELNGFNLTFLEKLRPWFEVMEEYLGLNIALIIKSETELAAGNVQESLSAAVQFKETCREYCTRAEVDFEEHWDSLSEEGGDGGDTWPSQHYMHPAMAKYPHKSTGNFIDERINELSNRCI